MPQMIKNARPRAGDAVYARHHLVAKIDPTHECIVCAYDPRFTVQCISSPKESRYQCYWFLSVVVAETIKVHTISNRKLSVYLFDKKKRR
jgi:hypothetical protein